MRSEKTVVVDACLLKNEERAGGGENEGRAMPGSDCL